MVYTKREEPSKEVDKRHPLQSVVVTAGVAFGLGVLVGRKQVEVRVRRRLEESNTGGDVWQRGCYCDSGGKREYGGPGERVSFPSQLYKNTNSVVLSFPRPLTRAERARDRRPGWRCDAKRLQIRYVANVR